MLKMNLSALGIVAFLSVLAGCASSSPTTGASSAGKGDIIAVADLPAAVTNGVQQAMPGAMITKARKQPDGNYHLSDVKLGGKEYTLTVSPDGTIVKKEDDDD